MPPARSAAVVVMLLAWLATGCRDTVTVTGPGDDEIKIVQLAGTEGAAPDVHGISVAYSDDEYQRLWDAHGFDQGTPGVDFDQQLVLFYAFTASDCGPPLKLASAELHPDESRLDPSKHPPILELDWETHFPWSACNDVLARGRVVDAAHRGGS